MQNRPISTATIGGRLKAWRKRLGITQEGFSQSTGLHIGVIRKYENDVNIPGGEALVAIGATGVNLHWLLMGEGELQAGDGTSVPPAATLHPRLAEVEDLLARMDEGRRAAVLDDVFSRVQEAKRVADLERIVRELSRKLG